MKFDLKTKEKLIVALDFDTLEEAKQLVETLGKTIVVYKVGLEIFLKTNGKIVDFLHKKNKKVFLDLKFHDITNTVKKACEYAIKKDVFMFNIHCSNGTTTMKEVSALLKKHNSNSLFIGVTILTNLSTKDIDEIYETKSNLEDIVLNMATLAQKNGLCGVVCSALESKMIKNNLGKEFLTICPGIRPCDGVKDDQNRVTTPFEAIKNGVDFLVIGRPITKSKNPKKSSQKILQEIKNALKELEG